jgi:hypothetical protein
MVGVLGCQGTQDHPAPSYTCTAVEACGGSVVGSWTLARGCRAPSFFATSGCPQPTVDSGLTAATMVLNADMTYQTTYTYGRPVQYTYADGCLSTGVPPETCADADQRVKTYAGMFPASFDATASSCTGDTTCVCSLVLSPNTRSSMGTYLIGTPNRIQLDDVNGSSSGADYCVRDGILHLLGDRALDDTMFVRK